MSSLSLPLSLSLSLSLLGNVAFDLKLINDRSINQSITILSCAQKLIKELANLSVPHVGITKIRNK